MPDIATRILQSLAAVDAERRARAASPTLITSSIWRARAAGSPVACQART